MTVQITPGLPQRGEGWLIRGEPRTIAADIDTTAPLTLHLGGGRPSAPVLSLPPSRTDGDLTCWDLSVSQVDQITDGLASVRVWIAAGTTSVVAGQLMVARQGDSAPGGRTVLTADRIVVGPQGIGVVSAGTTPGGHLVFVLDTGAELDAGMVPVPPSVEAAALSAASSASTAAAEAAAAGLSATAAQDAAASATASASTATAMADSAATARDQTLAVTGDAASSATASAASASGAATAAAGAASSAASADASAGAAAQSAASADVSADNAGASAASADASAGVAASSAATATAKASEASVSASAAGASETASAASEAASEAAKLAAAGSATSAAASAASAAASASTATTKAAEATSAAASMSAYTAADVLAKLKTVDGAGSGLDADLLDGKDSAEFVDTATAQTITGVKTMTAPAFVASTPAATFGPDLTPASLGDWTLSGGATWAAPNLTIPSGGSVSCTIPVVSGQTYQVDVGRSASSGGDMTVSIGAASISVASWANNRVTVVAAATGPLTLTVGGGTWVATVQSVVCREVTATAGPVGSPGASHLRASGTNVASGYNSQRSLTTGVYNVASGHNSQSSLTTGTSNVASGYDSQRSLTSGSFNVASGHNSQSSLTTGTSNVASGYDSQRSLTSGSSNVASGHAVQRSLTTGSNNVALGQGSQYSPRGVAAWATTTASRQTSIGHESGQGSSNQSDDIVTVGYRAIADGAKAMALGSMASAAHSGSVALGSDVTTTATGQVAVGARDVEVQDATKGLVLRSPDGSRWRATINNTGVTAWAKIV